jgi:transposase
VEHVGIDLGSRRSHIVVMMPTGEITERRTIETRELPSWLRTRGAGRIVMEACTQSPAIARAAQAAKHEAIVVPGSFVRLLGVGARGIKTDDRDALALARASVRSEQLPSVHLRSETSRSRRELISARATLVTSRASISLNIKSWLRGRLIVVKSRANTLAFCEAVRRAALETEDGLPMSIDVLLQTFEHFTTQIHELAGQISKRAENDSVCARLMTVPGVGPIVSMAFATQIDDIERFGSADELASYLALVPGEATTGGKTVRTGTIKAGPQHLKALLVQAAWVMWRARGNDPAVLWARAIAEKRGTRIAIVALARKIATVLYAVWKHDTPYDPSRTARARATPSRSERFKAPSSGDASAAPTDGARIGGSTTAAAARSSDGSKTRLMTS